MDELVGWNASGTARAKGGGAMRVAPLLFAVLAMVLLAQSSRAGSSTVYGEPDTSEGQEKAAVSGSLDKEGIRRVIQRHKAALRTCYEQALRTSPGLEGKVAVKFVIGAKGRVTFARPDVNTTRSAALADCIVGSVKTWVFPHGPEAVTVTYPFMFRSAPPEDGGAVARSRSSVDGGR